MFADDRVAHYREIQGVRIILSFKVSLNCDTFSYYDVEHNKYCMNDAYFHCIIQLYNLSGELDNFLSEKVAVGLKKMESSGLEA